MNLILRPILIDGEFFKNENLTEFNDGYNEIIKIDETIKRIDGDISGLADMFGKTDAFVNGVTNTIKTPTTTMAIMDKISTMEAGR